MTTKPGERSHTPERRDRIRGCLLLGAVGDALGAPVEFWSIGEIRARLGPAGVTGFIEDPPAVTDDTQMLLFTAEGLIRGSVRGREKGIVHPPSVVHQAYRRWLHTQGFGWDGAGGRSAGDASDGWLVAEQRLHRRRAPGNTCVSALESGVMGTPETPINGSKGCGGVMRAAPVGLVVDDPERAFRLGCEVAAITHGHPSGWLSAGALAAAVACLLDGATVEESVDTSLRLLGEWRDASKPGDTAETVDALTAARRLAERGLPEPEELERLGGGWVGEEALAIAACCALATDDPHSALLTSVNHSGDSDSTGAICGNLLGAAYGTAAIPRGWSGALDIGDIVERIADDLWTERQLQAGALVPPDDWWDRYPGW